MKTEPSPWLHRFAVLVALATLALIGMGGLVTSHGAGMAVPDWPTTYGYNMFLFPIDQWVGGIFYEHSHRLIASVVGLLTAGLAGWIWVRETNQGWERRIGLVAILATLSLMGVRTQGMFVALAVAAVGVMIYAFIRAFRDERPLRWWAAMAFCAVLVQGVLGGLRVTALKDELGIFHGSLAQLFLVLICALALATAPAWRRIRSSLANLSGMDAVRPLLLMATVLIFFQLILGATMRHQHAGLAVPDFPLAYGKIWPPMDAESIALYNQSRLEPKEYNAITPFHIVLHMGHRIGAILILVAVGAAAWRVTKLKLQPLAKWAWAWFILILSQAVLGAATVWSNKAADIATLHVVTGATSLAMGALLTFWAFQKARDREESALVTAETRAGSEPEHAIAKATGAA
jgi:cytochrome c oxidase assembly protein subunit 15